MDDDKKTLVIICILLIYIYCVKSKQRQREKKRKRDDNAYAMIGHNFTLELLHGNNVQCVEMLRMSRDAYARLCGLFKARSWLKDSKYISVEQKMTIFLMIIGRNQRFRTVKRMFQHSTQTIHKIFYEVLKKMIEFAKETIVPTSFDPDPSFPENDRILRKIFKGAIGAIDGTLIHAIIPTEEQLLYRRKDGDCYQNVLAACDFNMIFTFVVAGWEGSAYDSQVLVESISNADMRFPVPPPDKYYLCDDAYTNTRGFMAPYRNVRYWLGNFRRTRALNKYERFDHSHAKLRKVIENAYGILKARFPILKRMIPFPFDVQIEVVLVCFAIHNFIRKEGLSDKFFSEYDKTETNLNDEHVQGEDEDEWVQEVQAHGSTIDQQYMTYLRGKIADELMQNED